MAKPAPGNYFIVNATDKIAVTYTDDGPGAPLIITPFRFTPDQQVRPSFSFEIHAQDDPDRHSGPFAIPLTG